MGIHRMPRVVVYRSILGGWLIGVESRRVGTVVVVDGGYRRKSDAAWQARRLRERIREIRLGNRGGG